MSSAATTLDAEIVSDPAVRQAEPVIAGTTTSVRVVAELWQQGLAPEEIALRLPHLQIRQVFAALYYALGHRAEIDAFIAVNRFPEKW